MNNPEFSFIILTLDEEQHLPRLLNSISELKAATYVLDSGSTDQTLNICKNYSVEVKHHSFYNHPKQWHHALTTFNINTPWIIGLDADQTVTPELLIKLKNFKNKDYNNIEGIYFNRKNYFKGRWIRHGGYYPKYMLKMFRQGKGYSDLSESMDHRFQVPGKTIIWKDGHIKEENLKENSISFWLQKHDRYSDLLAAAEITQINNSELTGPVPKPWGTPNERNACLKKLWIQMPKYLRPILYFTYRMTFQKGILDGRIGIIYHFLQGFWFRLIVDIKIDEHLKKHKNKRSSALRFLLNFMGLFFLLYSFNIIYIAITTPGGFYFKWLDLYLNYISYWRALLISSTAEVLKLFNYVVQTNSTGLTVKGHSGFRLVYSCLGYGVMSYFSAFVIAFPKTRHPKFLFLIIGLMMIQILNIARFTLIAIYYNTEISIWGMDHHQLFNYLLYAILSLYIFLWTSKHA